MIPARHFAGRAPATPPSSDSESESKSGSDAEPIRPASVPRRRRFVARVVEDTKSGGQTRERALKPGTGFVPLKELQLDPVGDIQIPPTQPQPEQRTESSKPQPPPAPASSSSSSESSESESERSPSPPPQPSPPPSFKPVFIKPKAKEAPDTSRQDSRVLERKEEARQLVSAVLKEEEASLRNEGLIELPDDTDRDRDKPREEALWRVREMRRVLREREADKAWRNRGMIERETSSEEGVDRTVSKEANDNGTERESGKGVKEFSGRSKVGPFFADRGEDGRFTEEIYNREFQEGRGGLSGLRVGRDGGRSGRTKFLGLAQEDTAGELALELKRDRKLAATLEAAGRR